MIISKLSHFLLPPLRQNSKILPSGYKFIIDLAKLSRIKNSLKDPELFLPSNLNHPTALVTLPANLFFYWLSTCSLVSTNGGVEKFHLPVFQRLKIRILILGSMFDKEFFKTLLC